MARFNSRPTGDRYASVVEAMRDAADRTATSNHVGASGTANRWRGLLTDTALVSDD